MNNNEVKFKNVTERVRDFLKPTGFKKSGSKFYRKQENIVLVVEFQRDKSNDSRALGFTLNLGVASTTVLTLLNGISYFDVAKIPSTASCQVRYRIGDFTDSREDKWWKLTDETEETKVSEEVIQLIGRALSTISQVQSDDELCEFLKEKEAKASAAGEPYRKRRYDIISLLFKLNRIEEGRREIEELLALFPKKPHQEFFERIGASGAQKPSSEGTI